MIRHSSSFFLSLLLHIAILFVVFFIYEGVSKIEKPKEEKKISVKLCTLKKEKIPLKSKPILAKTAKKKLVKSKPKKIKKSKPKHKLKRPKKKIKPKKIKPKKIKPKRKKAPKVLKKEPEVVKQIQKVKPIPKNEPIVYKKVEKKDIEIEKEEFYDEVEDEVDVVELQSEVQRVEEVTNEYIDNHEDEIRKLINDNLYYPRRARKRRIQGEVKVRFTLSKDAEISDIDIISSKSDILSRAAVKTLKNLHGKFPKPSQTLIINIPIQYKLR